MQKITSFFETLSSQNKIGVEVGLGVEESGGLSAKEKFAASGGGGEDKTVPGKGLGVISTISNKATSARGLGGEVITRPGKGVGWNKKMELQDRVREQFKDYSSQQKNKRTK